MKKNNKTALIGELLHNGVFNNSSTEKKLNAVIKHSTIFSFWGSIVGARFSNFTKPYSIKGDKIYVSVKSPVVAQELSLYKAKILQKINSYSMPLGFEIKDIIFNYKNFVATNPIKTNQIEDKPVFIEKSELENTEIKQSEKQEISENVDKINFLNDEEKQLFAQKLINNSKAKIIQNNDSY